MVLNGYSLLGFLGTEEASESEIAKGAEEYTEIKEQ